MDNTKTGGPAFPHTNPGYDGNWDKRRQIEGMTLRDYFAAKAMPTMFRTVFDASDDAVNIGAILEKSTAYAYAMADYMLRAREAS